MKFRCYYYLFHWACPPRVMLNAERWFKNEEVEIRSRTWILLRKNLGTLNLTACGRQAKYDWNTRRGGHSSWNRLEYVFEIISPSLLGLFLVYFHFISNSASQRQDSEKNLVKTYSQSTSKRDPAVLFVFGCQQETGTEGKTHGNLWYLHQLVRSSNRRNSL